MVVVIFCSILALILIYLETIGKLNGGMLLGFALVTILQMIHYDYGNDYMSYYYTYLKIIQYDTDLIGVFDKSIFRDPGWALLNYLFKPFGNNGFFVLVACLSLFQGVIFYKGIRKYLDKKSWIFATFIYLFSTSFYLMNFSMLRQGLVITAFFAIWPLIEKRKVVFSVFIILCLSLVHSSASFLLPFVFWGFIPMKQSNKWLVGIFLVLIVAVYLSKDLLNDIFSLVISTSEDFSNKAKIYGNDVSKATKGFGFLLSLIPLLVSLNYISQSDSSEDIQKLVLLDCVAFAVTPFGDIIPLITRVGLYFSVFNIIVIPLTYHQIMDKWLRFTLTFLYIMLVTYNYLIFFKSPVWIDSFGGPFKTIFSVL